MPPDSSPDATPDRAGAAHDLANLLAVIMGQAEQLARTLPPGRERDRAVAVQRAARSAGALLHSGAWGGSGGPGGVGVEDAAPGVVDVGAVVSAFAPVLEGAADGHPLVVSVPSAPVWVCMHPHEVEQVVLNLVANAAEAQRGVDEPIDVDVRATDQAKVAVTVADRGHGISDAKRQRVLEPGVSTRGSGRGTGLASARAVARSRGGDVDLMPRLGGGTVARLVLPTTTTGPGDAPLVVVADDDRVLREVMADTLRDAGYRVAEADSGSAVLELARGTGDRSVAMVVADLVMPGPVGADLAHALAAGAPVPLLVVSGQELETHPSLAFLAKPFAASDLCDAVAALLAAVGARPPSG